MKARIPQLPRISVVVPSFNQARFLPHALESIFRQGYPDLEVVVMDGGSSDASVSIIRSFASRLKFWQSQKDGGQSAAINAGMRHCSGRLVAWLNSDDWYCENALWSVGQAYAEYPEHGLYVGNGLRYDQIKDSYTPFCSRHVAFNRAALLHGTDYLLQPSVFFLREAWEKVQGLDPKLCFCMDWDLFLRISARYPVVILQEFLAVSREYEETKTRSGKMNRAAEIVRMIQSHTKTEVTPGSLLYYLETLLGITEDGMPKALREHLEGAIGVVARQLADQYGGGHGFPEQSDAEDKIHLPFATATMALPSPSIESSTLPTISLITPSLNQCEDLRATLDSIRHQHYECLETLVVDGGSCDGSVEFVQRNRDHLSHVSAPDRGPAHAINVGLGKARGEILGWINPGDLLAAGALQAVGRAFGDDANLDLVYGNAVSIDGARQFHLANYGCKSGLWLGVFPTPGNLSACGTDVLAVAQPTVFFRRRLLERCGLLNESLHHIFDHELFSRFSEQANIKKLERIQAFSRARADFGTRWNDVLVEAYRLGRARWPGLFSRQFPGALREFLAGYLGRKFGGRPHKLGMLGAAALAGLSAVTRLGNPERWWANRLPTGPRVEKTRSHLYRQGRDVPYASLFCAPRMPSDSDLTPSGAREVQILRSLREFSMIEFFSQHADDTKQPTAVLAGLADIVHSPASIAFLRPDLSCPSALKRPLHCRVGSWLRRLQLPIPGPRHPVQVTEQYPTIQAFCILSIRETLRQNKPDFVFVSPQTNPLALMLAAEQSNVRMILIVHELEAERLQRVAESKRGIARKFWNGEACRARRYEQENLVLYDGVIVAKERDRQRLAIDYGYPVERIRVVGEEADPGLGQWLAWLKALPRYQGSAQREMSGPFEPERLAA